MIKHEVINTTDDYFTLKLMCYQAAGSGDEMDYYYTIDLKTGERLALKDLFKEGSDYITPISENIKSQMRGQMDADENVSYWLTEISSSASTRAMSVRCLWVLWNLRSRTM